MTDELVLTRSWPVVEPGKPTGRQPGRTAPICGSVLRGGPEREVASGGGGRPPARIGADRRQPWTDDKCNSHKRRFPRGRDDLRTRLPADSLHSTHLPLSAGLNGNYPAREPAARNKTAITLPDNRPVSGWNRTSRWPAVTCTRWGALARAAAATAESAGPARRHPRNCSSHFRFQVHRPFWRYCEVTLTINNALLGDAAVGRRPRLDPPLR
jgi:hypothetical protein